MTNKYNIVALFGKAGSGKDSVLSALVNGHQDWNKVINCTSRAPREKEKDGVDYHFISPMDFMERDNEFIWRECFNNWWYGTQLKDLKPAPAINVGVFNPRAIEQMFDQFRYFNPNLNMWEYNSVILPIYICCCDKFRLIHQLKRETAPNIPEIFRRYETDNTDFSQINFHYQFVYNEEGMLPDTVAHVTERINSYHVFFK